MDPSAEGQVLPGVRTRDSEQVRLGESPWVAVGRNSAALQRELRRAIAPTMAWLLRDGPAADLLEDYPAGVWVVDLAPLREPELVPHIVATAVGVREEPGRNVFETLASALRSRHLLLVLDNCEHLVAAADHVVRYGASRRFPADWYSPGTSVR